MTPRECRALWVLVFLLLLPLFATASLLFALVVP